MDNKMTTLKSNSANRLGNDSFIKFPNLRYEYLIGGISGGVTSTLALHPLDLIKIRFAVNDGKSTHTPEYKTVRNAFKLIIKEEGFRGLYKGVTANVLGSGSSWGLYFLYYNSLKLWLQDGDSKKALSSALNMFAAAQAGIFTLIITNPIWVVKTRLCLQIYGDNQSIGTQRYNGVVDGLIKIYKAEGMRGLYKGFVPGLFGVSHGSIQFMVYEEMKNDYNRRHNRPINEKLSNVCYISFAAISKLIAAAITYPYQVVRARLQDQNHSYTGTLDCIQKTFSTTHAPHLTRNAGASEVSKLAAAAKVGGLEVTRVFIRQSQIKVTGKLTYFGINYLYKFTLNKEIQSH